MKTDAKIIVILCIIVLLFGIIFTLRFTGVIKKIPYISFSYIFGICIGLYAIIGICKLLIKLSILKPILIFTVIIAALAYIEQFDNWQWLYIVNTILIGSGFACFLKVIRLSVLYAIPFVLANIILHIMPKGIMVDIIGVLIPVANIFIIGFGGLENSFGTVMGCLLVLTITSVSVYISYIRTTIKICQLFNKSDTFMGMSVVFPWLLLPMLGYSNDKVDEKKF